MESFSSFKRYKASGPDNFPADLLRIIGKQTKDSEEQNTYITVYTMSFNRILSGAQTPSQWKEATIIPVPKKGDLLNPNNYRGITLLNSTYKAFVHILDTRLSTFMDTTNQFVPE